MIMQFILGNSATVQKKQHPLYRITTLSHAENHNQLFTVRISTYANKLYLLARAFTSTTSKPQ